MFEEPAGCGSPYATIVRLPQRYRSILKHFDAHAPNDHDGVLRLLSFRTGHKPSTHSSGNALEHANPTKLQPDLIHRYLENIRVWHNFLLIGEKDVVEAVADHFIARQGRRVAFCGYLPDLPEQASRDVGPVEDEWSDAKLDCAQDPSLHEGRHKDQGQD